MPKQTPESVVELLNIATLKAAEICCGSDKLTPDLSRLPSPENINDIPEFKAVLDVGVRPVPLLNLIKTRFGGTRNQ